jgi:hypothetical protein
MDIVKKERIVGDEVNTSYELSKDGKKLSFEESFLGYLTTKLYCDDANKNLWFCENFIVDKNDTDIYKMIDDIFFSYGDRVFFVSEGDFVTLIKDDNTYKFRFVRGFNENYKLMEAKYVDYTEENQSLYDLYGKLQEYVLDNENVKDGSIKILTKSKKNIES